jgi:hypothetical protein
MPLRQFYEVILDANYIHLSHSTLYNQLIVQSCELDLLHTMFES